MKRLIVAMLLLFDCSGTKAWEWIMRSSPAFAQAPQAPNPPTGLTAIVPIETICPATMPFTCSLFFPFGNVEPFVMSWYGGTVPTGTYALTRGALPPGVVLDSDGLLHGTLDKAGYYECGFTITSADGTAKEFPIVFEVF